MSTVAADVHAHVLDDTQHRHFHFLEHHDAFFGVDQRDILRRGDHNGTRYRNVLRQRQLNVTGAWRHIQHQIIQIRPHCLLQHLQQRLAGHRAAPDHSVIVGHQVTDRVSRQAVRHDRRHMRAVRRGWTLVFRAQHVWNGRTVDIGIQNTDLCPFRRQRQRQVNGSRGFPHPALARTDGNDVFHPVDARLVFNALQRGDAVAQLPVNRFCAGNAQQLSAGLLFQRVKGAGPDERHLQLNVQRVVQPCDMV